MLREEKLPSGVTMHWYLQQMDIRWSVEKITLLQLASINEVIITSHRAIEEERNLQLLTLSVQNFSFAQKKYEFRVNC